MPPSAPLWRHGYRPLILYHFRYHHHNANLYIMKLYELVEYIALNDCPGDDLNEGVC